MGNCMTVGKFKELIDELELEDNTKIMVQYFGSDIDLNTTDCFSVKDDVEFSDKAVYLEIG